MSKKLIKKITTKTVVGNLKEVAAEMKDGESKAVMRVIGITSKTQTGESDFGPWVKFKGDFRATNLITGEEAHSGSCMLPEVASDLLEGTVLAADGNAVEFAFDISITADSSIAVGYTFEAAPLVEATEDSPLDRLAAQVGTPALEDNSKGKKAKK